jgi:hypothetical protein
MKNLFKLTGIFIFVMAIAFAITSCSSPDSGVGDVGGGGREDSGGGITPPDDKPILPSISAGLYAKTLPILDTDTPIDVSGQTGANMYEKAIAYANANPREYILVLNTDIIVAGDSAPTQINAGSLKLTLIGVERERTISLSSTGSILWVKSGIVVIGSNITLKGRTSKNDPLVFIEESGSVEMNAGAIIKSNVGGGVYVDGGTFNMIGGKILEHGNSTLSGRSAGVFITNDGTFTMSDGTISGNRGFNGGGVNVRDGTFTMNGGTISGNNSVDGGGVEVGRTDGIGIFTMNGGTISGNTADFGGGVDVRRNGTFTMTSGTIIDNTTNSYGGGVGVNGTFTMNGGTISGNSARSTRGGYALLGCGGGIVVWEGTFTMNSGTISNNTAKNSAGGSGFDDKGKGGGVYVLGEGIFNMNSGTISGNTASDDTANSGGGGVYVWTGTFNMTGGTIQGNSADDGGGVYVYGGFSSPGALYMVNGIIYGSNEVNATLNNTASTGAALSLSSSSLSTAQYGTFNGSTWNSNGSLTNTNSTIKVVNGVLQ